MSFRKRHVSEMEYDKQLAKARMGVMLSRNYFQDCKGSKHRRNLSKEQMQFIIDNFNKMSREEIAKHLNIKVGLVGNYVAKLNLANVYFEDNEYTYNELLNILLGDIHKYATNEMFDIMVRSGFPYYMKGKWKIVNLDDFYSWYKDHLKAIFIPRYKTGSLPNEPDWFVEKHEADKRAVAYMYKRPYTEEDKKLIKKLVNEGKTYMECSRILKRTGSAIKRLCYDLGINKPKRTKLKPWTEEQINKMKDLWLKGYEPCIISEEIGRSDREIQSYLERKDIRYFGKPPVKFSKSEADNYKIKVEVR